MKALNNKILVLPDPPKETSEGGILLPEKHREKPISGTVILTSDYKKEMLNMKEGSRVYYPSYSGFEIKLKLNTDKEQLYHIVNIEELWLVEN